MRIEHRPGMANELMRELAPILAEDGIDIDNLEFDSMEDFQAAMNRAVERHNMERFTPVGPAREKALAALREVAQALAAGDTERAGEILDAVPPDAPAGELTVAACMGAGLDLLDTWLSGSHPDTPPGLAVRTRLPRGHWEGGRAAKDVLALAAKGRAFGSLDSLTARQGGKSLLYGVALAVSATLQTWALLTDEPVDDLAEKHLR